MTVTTNERGQQNLFAREPQMYVSKTDAERYGYETYAERAEKLNGRTAMFCLLYTSPSPRDATLSRMPSSA